MLLVGETMLPSLTCWCWWSVGRRIIYWLGGTETLSEDIWLNGFTCAAWFTNRTISVHGYGWGSPKFTVSSDSLFEWCAKAKSPPGDLWCPSDASKPITRNISWPQMSGRQVCSYLIGIMTMVEGFKESEPSQSSKNLWKNLIEDGEGNKIKCWKSAGFDSNGQKEEIHLVLLFEKRVSHTES